LFAKDGRQSVYDNKGLNVTRKITEQYFTVRSVAAGFGRHCMRQPASNDTGTAFGKDDSDRSRDLATLTFDLGGHRASSG